MATPDWKIRDSCNDTFIRAISRIARVKVLTQIKLLDARYHLSSIASVQCIVDV